MGISNAENKHIGGNVFTIPATQNSIDEKARSESASSLEQGPVGDIDSKEERAFVWRLDVFFLTIGFLGYMFKYLDQVNVANAYVSGMKEDLNLHGNELNYFTTYFNYQIGYMLMLYPSCILISHVGPSVWLPLAEVIWGILTCCLSTVTKAEQAYGLRFLIGFFEGTAWPAYFTIISQWYMPHEVALRMSIYNIAQPTGAMLSGAMQGALAENFNGVLGRAGWRWAFIFNGACTILVALLTFVILPGYPERQNPLSKFYLKSRHIEIALARARRVKRRPQIGITPKSLLRALTFWQLWVFAIAWPLGGNFTPTNFYNLWLKSLRNPDGTKKYGVGMLNYLPIIGQGAQLVAELLFSGFSDYFGVRFPFLMLHSAINITSLVILSVRPENEHTYMAGWYLNYLGAVSMMLLCSWAVTNLQDEPQVRTLLFATGTFFAYLMNAFIPIAAFPAKEAPNWRIGAKLYLAFAIFSTFLFVGIFFTFRWEDKRKARKLLEEESTEEPASDSKDHSKARVAT